MAFLIRALDGEPGVCETPNLPALPLTVKPELVREAIGFLRRTNLPIEPRLRWPTGGMPQYELKGTIVPEHRAEPGMALCHWGDAGWGGLVRQGKYQDRHFSDELVQACARMVHEWNPHPAPAWVTCIPSLRHPRLVADFARRLAGALNLPLRVVLKRTSERPEQKAMANSTQQARNVDGSLAATVEEMPNSPVLLIDDMVDSRWTMTVAAWVLRSHGSGEVFPLALAVTGNKR